MSGELGKEIPASLKAQDSDFKKKIVLVLEYDGTNYCGFQFQENTPTVQDEVEKALFKLTGEKLRILAASRTDTGVHASGQVLSFWTGSVLKPVNFINGLNHFLPQDIAVKAAYKVNKKFSVQSDAISRQYHYLILNSSTRSPLKRGYTHRVIGELNLEAMNQAGQILIGERDLMSFVTTYRKSIIKSTFRTVYKAQVVRKGDLVVFDMVAKSFLPHQVRNTVGTLIRVGLGKISVEDFKSIMEARKPGLAGPTVPAQGLSLIRVNYPRPLGEYDEDL
jgi:tRNA pseudouridine38-40 synthase